MNTLDLSQHGIAGPTVLVNLSTAALYEEAIRYDRGTCISSTGALVAYSGDKSAYL
jgi:phosphoenolpyruvate carboxykinase (ATP)